MKLWQKTLLYSIALFLLIFNVGAYFLIENSYELNLKREVDRGLSEQLSVYSGVRSSIVSIKNVLEYSFREDFIGILLKDYMKDFRDERVYIEILDNNNKEVFSNLKLKVEGERIELKGLNLDKRQYIIRDIKDETYIFIASLLKVEDKYFKVTYIREISYIYEDKQKQYAFFIKLQFIIFIALFIGMYILSRHLTRPINKLIKSTQFIKEGNFSERVEIKSNDEIGILSDYFNEMAVSIEEKVFELEKSIEQKQRFIDNLTHELKTPLTSIIGYAELLLATKYNEETFLLAINYILKEGKRLNNLSEKMMDLILLKKENFIIKKESIKDIVLTVKEVLNNRLEEKNIDLIVQGKDYKILVERDLITNLIINLLDNAIKASDKDSKIYLSIYRNIDLEVVIEIKDKGIGISKGDISKVFEAFYMVDKSRYRGNNNIGMGLAICTQIAEVNKARIDIESKVNQGTVIKVIFEQ